jgi:predicted metalloprotease
MKWSGRRRSGNVEDQRGRSGGGFRGGIPRALFSKKGLIILAIIIGISWLSGNNPLALLEQIAGSSNTSSQAYTPTPQEEELSQFVQVVLADTEDVWNNLMNNYREPTLVLFSGSVQSACGAASASTGPFYCSADERIYIDLSFYNDLKNKLGAPGDFAQAYVIAHEVGHHVQHLLGISDKVHGMRNQQSEAENNALSVKLELQADFLAGVWAHYAQQMNIIEPGDFEEALNAANAIGDDRLQRQSQGYVVPDSFTHGTSEQRMFWFRRGYNSGDLAEGDTFSPDDL